MTGRVCVAMIGLAVLAPTARAERGPALLRYWWVEGQQVRWTIEARMTGPVSVYYDHSVDARVHLSYTVRAVVTQASATGPVSVRVSIDRLVGDVDLGVEGKVHFEGDAASNSFVAQADNGEKLSGGFGSRAGQGPSWTLHTDTLGRILGAEGFNRPPGQSWVGRGGGTLPILQGIVAIALPPDDLGTPCTQILGPELPSTPVKPGDEWRRTMPGPPAHCRYVGDETVDGVPCRRIRVTMDGAGLEWRLPSDLVGGVPVEVHQRSEKMTTDFWLAQDGCQVVQAKSAGADSALSESGATVTWTDARVEFETRRQ